MGFQITLWKNHNNWTSHFLSIVPSLSPCFNEIMITLPLRVVQLFWYPDMASDFTYVWENGSVDFPDFFTILTPKGKLWTGFLLRIFLSYRFCVLKKPSRISGMYGSPRKNQCIIFISSWTLWADLKTLGWTFWNHGQSELNHAYSKASPKIQ